MSAEEAVREALDKAAWWESTCEYWHEQADEARHFKRMVEVDRDYLRAKVARVEALCAKYQHGAWLPTAYLRAALGDGTPRSAADPAAAHLRAAKGRRRTKRRNTQQEGPSWLS